MPPKKDPYKLKNHKLLYALDRLRAKNTLDYWLEMLNEAEVGALRQQWDKPPSVEYHGRQIPLPGIYFHEPDIALNGVALGLRRTFHEFVPDFSRVVIME